MTSPGCERLVELPPRQATGTEEDAGDKHQGEHDRPVPLHQISPGWCVRRDDRERQLVSAGTQLRDFVRR